MEVEDPLSQRGEPIVPGVVHYELASLLCLRSRPISMVDIYSKSGRDISVPSEPNCKIVEAIIDIWNYIVEWNAARQKERHSEEFLRKNPIVRFEMLSPGYLDLAYIAYALAIPLDWFPHENIVAVGFGLDQRPPERIDTNQIDPSKLSMTYMVKYWNDGKLDDPLKTGWLFDSPALRSRNPFAEKYASALYYYDHHIPRGFEENNYFGWMKVSFAVQILNWLRAVLFCSGYESKAFLTGGIHIASRHVGCHKFDKVTAEVISNVSDRLKDALKRGGIRMGARHGVPSLLQSNCLHDYCCKVIDGYYSLEHQRISEYIQERLHTEALTSEFENRPDKFEPNHYETFGICGRFMFDNARILLQNMAWKSLFQTQEPFPLPNGKYSSWLQFFAAETTPLGPEERYKQYLSWCENAEEDQSGVSKFVPYFQRMLSDFFGTVYTKTILCPMDPEILRVNLESFAEDVPECMETLTYVRPLNDGDVHFDLISPHVLAHNEEAMELDFIASAIQFRNPSLYRRLLNIHNETCTQRRLAPYFKPPGSSGCQ